jgi:hypothetical protein
MVKYDLLVGDVQSGKTAHEIKYCYDSIKSNIPVIFIIRNILADKLQLIERFKLSQSSVPSGKDHTDHRCFSIKTIDETNLFDQVGVIIILCNPVQFEKLANTGYTGLYNLCIDEVDFSIKSKDFHTRTDKYISLLKKGANSILGATATPFAVFSSEKLLNTVKKLEPGSNYKGIHDVHVEYIDPVIIKNVNRFPVCDHYSIKKVYSSCLKKDRCVLLHTVVKEKILQRILFDYLSLRWAPFTMVLYNGDGIVVYNGKSVPLLKKSKKYYFNEIENLHYFTNTAIAVVLQLIKDDTYISIISGQFASRGISFVSTDYSLHLTDQYFHPSKTSHGENLLQSLRILGCYNDSVPLTLWCSQDVYSQILEQHRLLKALVYECSNEKKWLDKLHRVSVQKPARALSRPKLIMGTKWSRADNSGNYTICIEHFDEIKDEPIPEE